jgi:hypothetical protein
LKNACAGDVPAEGGLTTLAGWKILSFFMKEIDYETEVRLA